VRPDAVGKQEFERLDDDVEEENKRVQILDKNSSSVLIRNLIKVY